MALEPLCYRQLGGWIICSSLIPLILWVLAFFGHVAVFWFLDWWSCLCSAAYLLLKSCQLSPCLVFSLVLKVTGVFIIDMDDPCLILTVLCLLLRALLHTPARVSTCCQSWPCVLILTCFVFTDLALFSFCWSSFADYYYTISKNLHLCPSVCFLTHIVSFSDCSENK